MAGKGKFLRVYTPPSFPPSMRALSPALYLRIVVQSIGGSVTEPPPPVTAAVSSHSVPSHRRPPRDRAGTVRISPRSAWKQTTWKSEPELRARRIPFAPPPLAPRPPDHEDPAMEIFQLISESGFRLARLKDSRRADIRSNPRSVASRSHRIRETRLLPISTRAKRAPLRTLTLAVSRHPSQLHLGSTRSREIEEFHFRDLTEKQFGLFEARSRFDRAIAVLITQLKIRHSIR